MSTEAYEIIQEIRDELAILGRLVSYSRVADVSDLVDKLETEIDKLSEIDEEEG